MLKMKRHIARERSNHELLRGTTLFAAFSAERDEILKLKWVESEKAGHDIGFERALLDWVRNHRDRWWASRRKVLGE